VYTAHLIVTVFMPMTLIQLSHTCIAVEASYIIVALL